MKAARLGVAAASFASAFVLVLVACGTSATEAPDLDAGAVTPSEAGPSDAGDAAPARPDAAPVEDASSCLTLPGECDLVLQGCPRTAEGAVQECRLVRLEDAGYGAACRPAGAGQQLPLGRACCDDGQSNPCLPGLTCVGEACRDGAPPTGRCAPACCPGQDAKCGASEPEGIAGACDVVLTDERGDTLHRVCSYKERCKPFGVEPCKVGQGCLVEDRLGSASCVFVTGGGKRAGAACDFANECVDGTMCLGGQCRTLCLTPNSLPPFDAGALRGGPGGGGCPAGERCDLTLPFDRFPGWISLCRFTDGG